MPSTFPSMVRGSVPSISPFTIIPRLITVLFLLSSSLAIFFYLSFFVIACNRRYLFSFVVIFCFIRTLSESHKLKSMWYGMKNQD